VTWQMGRKRLLATSNESRLFEKQIKKKCVGKKGIGSVELDSLYEREKKMLMR
jgi:hypothetical protein